MSDNNPIKLDKNSNYSAIVLAVLAAVFYAISTPAAKVLLRSATPTMLAAFFYLGAGIGIGILYLLNTHKYHADDKLTKRDLPYTIAMVLLDIIAPILLLNGVSKTTAANASLLNNFEIVMTSLIAFCIFKERISKRMWMALLLVTVASCVLSFEGSDSLSFTGGSLMVLAAASCWGLENNCTRKISSKNTYQIVVIKGICSGVGSLIIGLVIGNKIPSLRIVMAALLVGFVAYGLSIFTYVRAQNILGAAKTSAFYAIAPFVGAILSLVFLKEPLTVQYAIGLIIMLAGTYLACRDMTN